MTEKKKPTSKKTTKKKPVVKDTNIKRPLRTGSVRLRKPTKDQKTREAILREKKRKVREQELAEHQERVSALDPNQELPKRNAKGHFLKGAPGRPVGLKNKRGKHSTNVVEALKLASAALQFPETFDPLKKLIELIELGDMEDCDKGALCAKMLDFIYPKKRAVEMQIEPGSLPFISMVVRPDGDGQKFADNFVPGGSTNEAPIILQIGGKREQEENEQEETGTQQEGF